ncbi:lipid A 3-O-deacylase PagL [Rhizobium sp. PP-F2F-G38]|nr:lipid A 3-O-deacylase PagL [Rhizobium sp. PP-WC-1G-195]PYF00529.1 lipid A 3-O-deacylase PagL [Rhizobium sp. PP-F2F-G38]
MIPAGNTPPKPSRRPLALACFLLVSGQLGFALPASAGDGTFDELRFGATASIADGNLHEDGAFPSVTLFFDPFDRGTATDWRDALARPRVHVGGEIGTGNGANLAFAGLNWTFDVSPKLFLDAGFGGLVHDGNLDGSGEEGPRLGCRLLFHEYAAIGYRLDEKWSLIGQVEHASHAKLCDGPNGGFTRAGLTVGYQF